MYSAIYCFDVDDTLALQGSPRPGPVVLNDVIQLRNQGIPTGISGNFLVLFKILPDWWKYFSFYGPQELLDHKSLIASHTHKHLQLIDIKKSLPAMRYVMVGNAAGNRMAVPGSQDDIQAHLAKWEFISETDFSKGKR